MTEDLADLPNLGGVLPFAKPEGLTGVPLVNTYAYVYVLAYRDENGKVGVYSRWADGQAAPLPEGQEREYYDFTVADGFLELNNQPELGTDATSRLLEVILPQEILRPMPNAELQRAQQEALEAYWRYVGLANGEPAVNRPAHML